MERVSAERNPERCVPPSTVLMVFANAKNIFHHKCRCIAARFDFDGSALAFDVNGRVVQRGFAAVEMLDEFGDAAGEAKLRALLGALVSEA